MTVRAVGGHLWLAAVKLRDGPRAAAQLVARARNGDPSAFDEIVRCHQKQVYNLAWRMLRNREDAEDVTQEAFLKAFESLPRLRDNVAMAAWICRITANLCLSRLRSQQHQMETPTDPCSVALTPTGGVADDVQTAQVVYQGLAQLPPEYRLAVVACYLEGRSYEEAAGLAGVGVRTFKTRLYRARRRLRDLLAPALLGGEDQVP
jgi:RNA polymerase sigma-70 factor (ECF subfamily)